MNEFKFTVFTPTYNRAYTLERVFDSLMNQTISHESYEWILIDDGSTDNTKELVDTFLEKTDFEIYYIKQENMGKNYCHNRAIKLAKGELFLILDSDDAVTDDCMEVFWNYWKNIDLKIKEDLYGIGCLCKNGHTGELIGYHVAEGLIENQYKWKHQNRVYFDSWAALNTNIFKQYVFPEISDVKFIPEALLWDMVGNKRKFYSTNEILKVVWYQDDGFSNDIVRSYKQHAHGRYIYHQMVINELFYELLKYNSLRLIKDFIQYGRMGLHSKFGFLEMLFTIKDLYKKLFFLFTFPVSYFFFVRDCRE